jgi:hypothetical protein
MACQFADFTILLAYTGFDQVLATVEDHFVLAPVWIVIYKSTLTTMKKY